ncbi:MAG: PspC domain-containing protein [Bacteroidota bacterium]|nr:PspC domain-containing protein [Bacteroidota bacterium]
MEETRLYRSKRDRVFAGVAGGLGEYFNVDPIIFRIGFIALTLGAGTGVLIYILLWIFVPESNQLFNPYPEDMENPFEQKQGDPNNVGNDPTGGFPPPTRRRNGGLWGGVMLITIGGLFLISNFVPNISFHELWPVVLIAVGAMIILNKK